MLDDDSEDSTGQRVYLEQCEAATDAFFEKLRLELTDSDPDITEIKKAKFD